MRRILLFLFPLLSLFGAEANPLERVEDFCELQLKHPDFSEKKTAKLRLKNGLEVFLISDPKCDVSAAALAVEVGSWDDPQGYPGMAHFCEHMLFMGTKKYPHELEFFSNITNYQGQFNAFTMSDRTVFMFSSQSTGFLPLLDQFAHFFIDPLLSQTHIARELHAVDQEFSKALEHDGWRSFMVTKEMVQKGHPHQLFSCGNSETLSKIPENALREWMKAHYSADIMHLVLYSPLPLSELEEALQSFQDIEVRARDIREESPSIFSKEQIQHITYIEPIQNRQTLSLTWELPSSLACDPSQPANLIAYALESCHEKSLHQALKKEGLVDNFFVGVEELAGKQNSFFQVVCELTDEGMEKLETVISYVLETLSFYQRTGVPSYLFDERKQMKKLAYEYQTREDAFQTVLEIARYLPDEELSTFPQNLVLARSYDPQKLKETLDHLIYKNVAITLLAPMEKRGIAKEREEKWMKVPYTSKPLSSLDLSLPRDALDLIVALPNPFVPQKLESLKEKNDIEPSLFSESEMGKAYFAQDTDLPQVNIHLHILSSIMDFSAKSQVLQEIYLDHLTDHLLPTLQASFKAKLSAQITKDRGKFHLQILGFSEKALLLMQKILSEMPKHPPTKEEFQLYITRHKKGYLNREKNLAYLQGHELLSSLLLSYELTPKEKLYALDNLSYEDFVSFHQNLFQNIYLEGGFFGNLSLKDVEDAWIDAVYTLGKAPFPKEQHPKLTCSSLPLWGPLSLRHQSEMKGTAALLVLDQGKFSPLDRGIQMLLSNALNEAFFHELRTKQKTGYIANIQPLAWADKLFALLFVQSNSHLPDELLHRFELFLETYLQEIEQNIPESRFETMKQSSIDSLRSSYRNLKEKGNLWDQFAFQKGGNFAYLDQRIEALEKLDYASFIKTSKNWIDRKNRKRLAILVDGEIPHPFSFQPIEKRELVNLSE